MSGKTAKSVLTFLSKFDKKALERSIESNKFVVELFRKVNNISSRITILIDKIHTIEERINQLTTVHEELLYAIEQFGQTEDKRPRFKLNSSEKKFNLN